MILTLAQNTVQVPWYTILLAVLFLLVCVIMILTVLIQRPQGGGLSGAFGSGAGSGQTAFGSRTGDALTVATVGIFVVYLLIAVALNFLAKPSAYGPVVPTLQSPPGANETTAGQPSEDAANLVGDSDETDVPEGDVEGTTTRPAAGEVLDAQTQPPADADSVVDDAVDGTGDDSGG